MAGFTDLYDPDTSGYEPQQGMWGGGGADSTGWGADTGGGGGNWWGDLANMLKGPALDFAGAAGTAGAGALFGQLGRQHGSPGTPSTVQGVDVRTGTGQAAEDTRLGAAQGAGKRFAGLLGGGPYAGGMNPEEMAAEENKIRAGSRNADAARFSGRGGGSGSLETGGSALRETSAVEQFRRNQREVTNQEINRSGQLTGQLTGGFQQMAAPVLPGMPGTPDTESPWSRIMSSAMAPSIGRGVKSILSKYI